jgi:outer membrane receptor protein involved in Fe transport
MRDVWLCALLLIGVCAAAEEPKRDQPQPYSETVEVTASRTEQPLLDAPVAVTVIDRKQIESTPAGNYADLLRGVPGLNAIQTSARDVVVRTRGATKVAENTQLVLLDGRSVYLDYYGLVIWDYLPVSLDELDSVEIVRGPGSVVWGANAMSGVINLRTRRPRDLAGGLVSASVGERGSRAINARWAAVLGPWSYKVSAGYFEQNAWPRENVLPDGSPFPFGYTYTNEGTKQPKLDGRLDRELAGDTATLSLRAGYGGTQGIFHSSIGPFAIQPGAYTDYAEVEYTRGALEARAYWNHLNGDAPNVLNGIAFSFENHTFVLEAAHRKLVAGKHMLVYGATARQNRFNLSLAPGYNARSDGGVYLEDIVELTPKLELNAGARADYFDTFGAVISPRLSLIIKPTADQAFRLAANRAYRAPTLVENYLYTPVPNVYFLQSGAPFFFYSQALGNQHLRRESVDALEAGWSWQHGPLFLSTAIYRNTIHDNVVFFPTEFFTPADPPPGWPDGASAIPPFALAKTFTYLNVGTVRNQGVELSADARFRRGITAHASYTLQSEPRATSHVAGVPLSVNRPPRHMAELSLDRHAERWFGTASVTYTGRAFWADVLDPRFWGYSKAYTLVNASAGWSLTRTTQLVVRGTNLLDRPIKQHVFGDTIGRKISIEVRQRF